VEDAEAFASRGEAPILHLGVLGALAVGFAFSSGHPLAVRLAEGLQRQDAHAALEPACIHMVEGHVEAHVGNAPGSGAERQNGCGFGDAVVARPAIAVARFQLREMIGCAWTAEKREMHRGRLARCRLYPKPALASPRFG